jgi:hypothetical protein
MRVIFITSGGQDNLEDAVFHGFRTLFGEDCIDYPKKEAMYKNFASSGIGYGGFFTIWRTLDDIPVDRENIIERIKADDYDLIVFGSIYKTYGLFRELKPFLKLDKTILLDGEDHVRFRHGTQPFLYFKRELQPKTRYYYTYKLTPRFLYSRLPPPGNIQPISFCIPKEKITFGITKKDKVSLLQNHIVDEEVRQSNLAPKEASTGHVFNNEADYFRNLQGAQFGITTMRGGWDCLRHYEIAANGAVICFRNLDAKYPLCAPHGLDRANAIIYKDLEDLRQQIENISDENYESLIDNGYKWVSEQTTEVRAKEIIDRLFNVFHT